MLRARTAYNPPPDQQMLVNGDATLWLSHSQLVHFVRPSADLLFESATGSYRERAIAVVLTGTGRDGTMGVRAAVKVGGRVIARVPTTDGRDRMMVLAQAGNDQLLQRTRGTRHSEIRAQRAGTEK